MSPVNSSRAKGDVVTVGRPPALIPCAVPMLEEDFRSCGAMRSDTRLGILPLLLVPRGRHSRFKPVLEMLMYKW